METEEFLLSKDLKKAAKLIKRREARFLVNQYYKFQTDRIRANNAMKAAEKAGEPTEFLKWTVEKLEKLEASIRPALKIFAKQYMVGQWLQSICGIGPVISAGLITRLKIETTKTVEVDGEKVTTDVKITSAGDFMRYAGLDPTIRWLPGEKCPWNQKLKKLVVFILAESFVKQQNRPNDIYGKLYRKRKAYELENNIKGRLVDQALAKKKFFEQKGWKNTPSYLFYAGCLPPRVWEGFGGMTLQERKERIDMLKGDVGSGLPMLPPDHIHGRAKNWLARIFLSHLQHVMYFDFYGKDPPAPYIFTYQRNNPNAHDFSHYIPVPNWPFQAKVGSKSLKEMG